jgi:hypothetical protein
MVERLHAYLKNTTGIILFISNKDSECEITKYIFTSATKINKITEKVKI